MKFSKSMLSPVKAWKYLVKEPVTIPKKDIFDQPREAADRYRGFHINHHDQCVGCGSCSEICPTEAITMIPIEGREKALGRTDELPAFDYGRCSFCGLCVDICTSDSLKMTKEYIHISTDVNSMMFLPDELGIHHTYYENGYTRDESSELLNLKAYSMDEIPHEGRNESFMELIKGFSKEMAISEASRCVSCGVCTDTCPAHMHIPEYIQTVYDDDMNKGLSLLYETNPLPNVCGRICTHKCETACVIGNRGEAVSIRWLKRYIVDMADDQAYDKMIVQPLVKPSKQAVAIVGSGPAGLSAAYYLRTMGYEVTVYESRPQAGGVVRYGAPEYRLPDEKVSEDVSVIERTGVKIITNTTVGKDISLEVLHEKFDAVFVATGFWKPKYLDIPNTDHPDVCNSIDFLAQARDYTRKMGPMPEIHEKAIVIGGGDVSFDVARTLVRFQNEKFGKHHVAFIARKDEKNLAASLEEILEAREEGVIYNLNASPVQIDVDAENRICGVTVSKCETLEIEGRLRTISDPEQQCCIEGTQVYFAVGTDPDYDYLLEKLEGQLKIERNKLKIKENGQVEGIEWLFAGGDIVHGPDIISAIADGHEAARGIDAYLMKK
ncbi:MAG: FAD-dependent oxidoreductase [Clostridia bacterium]|nr:FAD-dependent oxidoreductase [Clostridia bacterium]